MNISIESGSQTFRIWNIIDDMQTFKRHGIVVHFEDNIYQNQLFKTNIYL